MKHITPVLFFFGSVALSYSSLDWKTVACIDLWVLSLLIAQTINDTAELIGAHKTAHLLSASLQTILALIAAHKIATDGDVDQRKKNDELYKGIGKVLEVFGMEMSELMKKKFAA